MSSSISPGEMMREDTRPRSRRTENARGKSSQACAGGRGKGKSGSIFSWVLLGFSWLPVLHANLYSFVATYILGYDVYLTTGKILTGENGEGSNACTLPCGVGCCGSGSRPGHSQVHRIEGHTARAASAQRASAPTRCLVWLIQIQYIL